MHRWLSIVSVGLGMLAIAACGSSGSDGGTRGGGGTALDCATLTDPPDDCDKSCNSDSECTASFCENNAKCVAHCTADEGCGTTATCDTRRGRCIPNMGNGGTGGGGNTNGCQSVTITPSRSIPNVMFLVDQSASMLDPFGGGNRWQGAHSAITSIVAERASIVNFALTTYTSDNGDDNLPCPRLPTQIPFGQSADIGDPTVYVPNYPSGDGADTPTGDSIDALVDWIQDPDNAPPADEPTIIVLATDGLPDSCECPDSGHSGCATATFSPREEAVNAATAAHAQGIDVFALWVGDLSNDPTNPTRRHMQDVANAGVAGTGTVWVGDEPTSLSNAFQSIVSNSISCDIQMDKRFDDKDKACNDPNSDVRLNNRRLDCDSEWRVKPGADDVIELVDSACTEFKSGSSTFSAVFPCGAIVVD